MGADYHYSRDGQSFGPVSVEQLRQLAATGQLGATDLVWKEGMAEWVPACRFKGLILAAPSTPVRIAIIGTEVSGKTVLTTVLAKRYSHATAEGLFLDPLDNATLKFVERNYQFLASGDWPPSSPVGGLSNLRWRLRIGSNPCSECELHLADSAGQDLRRVFGDDQEIQSLPEHLRGLAEYCRTADVVIYLINLKDFVGENDPVRRLDNEAVIKSTLDFLIGDVSRRRQLCVLFTQADQFEQEREKCGSWENVAQKYLSYVHGAHLRNGRVTVGAVAAVKDTKVVELDGTPRRVPAPGFRSDGLIELMNWIATKAGELVAARVAEVQRIEAVRQEQDRQRIRQAERRRVLPASVKKNGGREADRGSARKAGEWSRRVMQRLQRTDREVKKKLIWAALILAAIAIFLLTCDNHTNRKSRAVPLSVPHVKWNKTRTWRNALYVGAGDRVQFELVSFDDSQSIRALDCAILSRCV
jgi:hypothetical protein